MIVQDTGQSNRAPEETEKDETVRTACDVLGCTSVSGMFKLHVIILPRCLPVKQEQSSCTQAEPGAASSKYDRVLFMVS